jgi:hypothetical protein
MVSTMLTPMTIINRNRKLVAVAALTVALGSAGAGIALANGR